MKYSKPKNYKGPQYITEVDADGNIKILGAKLIKYESRYAGTVHLEKNAFAIWDEKLISLIHYNAQVQSNLIVEIIFSKWGLRIQANAHDILNYNKKDIYNYDNSVGHFLETKYYYPVDRWIVIEQGFAPHAWIDFLKTKTREALQRKMEKRNRRYQ
jgi:hypothetical protein